MPRSNRVDPRWSRNLKEAKDRDDFDYYVANSRGLLIRLGEIIDEMVSALDRSEDDEQYASPVWPMLQADRIGQRKAFSQLQRLIKGSINNNAE